MAEEAGGTDDWIPQVGVSDGASSDDRVSGDGDRGKGAQ